MAIKTKIEVYPKSGWTSDEVDAVRASHMAHQIKSCVKSDDEDNWYLTIEIPVIP